MSIGTKFVLSAVILIGAAATASAAPRNYKTAVPRSGPQTQTTVPRTDAFSNTFSPGATGGGSPGYNRSLLDWR